MFLCLLSLLLLPIFSVAALWYINGSAPNIVVTLAKNGVSTLTPLILRVFLVVVRFIESSRSTYVWETRAMSPAFVRRVLDWGMVVDASGKADEIAGLHGLGDYSAANPSFAEPLLTQKARFLGKALELGSLVFHFSVT